jgi:hypothetical protein
MAFFNISLCVEEVLAHVGALHAVCVPSNSNSLSDGSQALIALLWCSMQVLLLSMLAPKSYTSEDVIELHCHGGGVCVQRVLGCCLREGARLAKPGEFTLRAFLNGRLDLSQVSLHLLEVLQVMNGLA